VNIHEFQAKDILRRCGVPIPPGRVARTPDEALAIARDYGGTVVVKAQVHAGGRGKAGGVKLAKSPDEAKVIASKILGMQIKGLTVHQLLISHPRHTSASSSIAPQRSQSSW
jgi:succinyl-CoA synthetase beta subunit